jgi:hypothetical protein
MLPRLTFILAFIALIFSANAREDLSEVKKQMIEESINHYSGHCPCPYNLASNGSHCGGRSAYNRPGGYAPFCYETDITDEEAIRWYLQKQSHPL